MSDEPNIDDLALAGEPSTIPECYEDITPPESAVPIYLDSTPDEPVDEPVFEPAVDEVVRASAIRKLVRGEPLTQAEAKLVTSGAL